MLRRSWKKVHRISREVRMFARAAMRRRIDKLADLGCSVITLSGGFTTL